MAAAIQMLPMSIPRSFNNNNNQCIDPDTEAFFDFTQLSSPTASSSRLNCDTPSTVTSPQNAALSLDSNEDLQTHAKPSYNYESFKQQTGLPSNSLPGIGPSYNAGYFPSTGLDLDSTFTGFNTGLGMETDLDMDMDMSGMSGTPGMPAYFFPSSDTVPKTEEYVDPSSLTPQEVPTVRAWPGMHQQQAQAKIQAQQQRQQQLAQQQQQQQQQKKQSAQQQQSRPNAQGRGSSSHITKSVEEETISRIMHKIRQDGQSNALPSQSDGSNQSLLPHIVRMKKDEEDMDEDERLLASEEGKKLTSKERRQLRNKVSARAFRSRRKEYIGQLEGEVAVKTNEANELRAQNRSLMEENARSRAFIERLLRHKAFTPFLEELSREETLQSKPSMSAAPTPAPAAALPQQMGGMSQVPTTHVGMTMIPETPIDMSQLTLNTNNNWGASNMNFNFQQPQVFAVLELPEGPSNPIDTEALAGKSEEYSFPSSSPVIEQIKPDFPTIERPIPSTPTSIKPNEDEDDPELDLYRSSPAPAPSPSVATPLGNTPLFGHSDPAKTFTHIELFISDDVEERQLMDRFERIIAAVDPVLQRIQAMTSHLDT